LITTTSACSAPQVSSFGGGGRGGVPGNGSGAGGAGPGPGLPPMGLPTSTGGMSGTNGGVIGAGDRPACATQTTPLSYVTSVPDVVIAFDKSGSMALKFGTGTRLTT